MTTSQKKSSKSQADRKQTQAAREQEIIEGLRLWLHRKEAYRILVSEVTGLYDEMDKLSKKAPNEPITQLQLKITNKFINKAKHLLSEDTIIDEVEVFISAGDNPEYRDVITVLRQIRQGLDRFKAKYGFLFEANFGNQIKQYGIEDEGVGNFFSEMSNSEDGATK